ncbi:hypothetical protein SAMN05660420_00454 [Desulfuromusa kysingii]|uniref:Uncharacterized protein n=1 Tax=Desulfuromusa kysingii TaxID=37625 RepID=A0A1H3W5P2_9BACT|nr:hypothetical protein [Desulfuromusa kysingii]SDZ81682.1 hypothetical protein SAMN05660420_00454 [Desulfuromusa kysingii]
MSKYSMSFLYCFLLLFCLQHIYVPPAVAGEKQERVKLLQQKMEKLQELLAKMEEEKLREQPPTEMPWQALLQEGTERPAYDQYAYLLAPLMRAGELDSILQQVHFLASQDEMKERGTLFIVPATPLAAGESMSVKNYNRDLAGALLQKVDIPKALEGGVVVVSDPLETLSASNGMSLFIDLTGCDQVLRSRIFGLLQKTRLFTEDGSIYKYLEELLRSASPQAFTVYMQGDLVWLSLAKE